MFTRKLAITSSSAAALLLVWFGQTASATEEIVVYGSVTEEIVVCLSATEEEEIVVYGTEALARLEAQRAMFRAEMDEYVRSLKEQIKARLESDVTQMAAPKLEVASSENRIRS